MPVTGEQDPSVDGETARLGQGGHSAEEVGPIGVIPKERPPLDPANHRVVQGVGRVEPRLPGVGTADTRTRRSEMPRPPLTDAELLALLGSEEEAKRGAKVALVLDLVRRGKLSRAKAAELLQMPLWDLPDLLAQYRIPWFDHPPQDLQRDLETLRQQEGTSG